jgi:TPR repeat protein
MAKVNLKLLAKGNKKAAWELGLQYMQGLGVAQDFARAESMFEIGAETADEKGMVGMFYAVGFMPKNVGAAVRWYTVTGRPEDRYEIAQIYRRAAKKNVSVADQYYKLAIELYVDRLHAAGDPHARLAEIALGNFVLDGIFKTADDADSRAQSMGWARMAAQELLGQKEYQSAVEYKIGNEDLRSDPRMWLRYCERAAAYNIDNAQHYYVEALNQGAAHDFSGLDAVAWTRLNSQKMFADKSLLRAMTASMTSKRQAEVDAAYQKLVKTHEEFGAYYVEDDPLRDPAPEVLAEMDQDDPDVQLREAFNLEKTAANDELLYEKVLAIYRKVRDHAPYDFQLVLGRYALSGANGVPKSHAVADYWLSEAVRSGSPRAQQMLDQIRAHTRPE